MRIQTIGVIGCGLMGSGIVEVAARTGFDVIVSEANNDFNLIVVTHCMSMICKC